jgi:hypothetical protein
MEKTTTCRGFGLIEFKDRNGVECTIQESSECYKEGLIWFGAKDIGLQHFKAYEGWKDVELVNTIQEHYVANNRMHLTQSQVKELLPVLKRFAKTGSLS